MRGGAGGARLSAMNALALLLALPALAVPDTAELRRMARAQDGRDLAAMRSALESPAAAQRAEAAWALGQLGFAEGPDGGPETAAQKGAREAAAAALTPAASDPDAGVREAAVEGLGKVGEAADEATLRAAATDADPKVRAAAALALFRLRQLQRVPEYSTAAVNALIALAVDSHSDVRWLAPYALSRWPEPRARGMLEKAQLSPDPRARLFAARALGKLGVEPDLGLLSDADLYVRAEAVAAFGAAKMGARLPLAVLADPSAHVRAAAADALAASGRDAPGLESMARSDSPLPRGRALLALAKLRGEGASAELDSARRDPSWWVRARAYEAYGALPGGEAALLEGLEDADARVASAALEALAASTAPAALAAVEAVLRDPKAPLELLGTAVDAAASASTVPVAALLDAARSGAPGLTAEVRGSIRKALAPFAEKDPAVAAALKRFPASADEPRRYRPLKAAPVVVLETSKGPLELLLDHLETPNHAAAIADAVKRKVYDGSSWHRVVTAFVVQGGDPRGSGWGDDGWRLADEIGRRRFVRGTVGMPKAGKDTGGCQLFVSLVPTPHLDGRYTAFGQVTAGLDVLDRIEPGDAIIRAYLK